MGLNLVESILNIKLNKLGYFVKVDKLQIHCKKEGAKNKKTIIEQKKNKNKNKTKADHQRCEALDEQKTTNTETNKTKQEERAIVD